MGAQPRAAAVQSARITVVAVQRLAGALTV